MEIPWQKQFSTRTWHFHSGAEEIFKSNTVPPPVKSMKPSPYFCRFTRMNYRISDCTSLQSKGKTVKRPQILGRAKKYNGITFFSRSPLWVYYFPYFPFVDDDTVSLLMRFKSDEKCHWITNVANLLIRISFITKTLANCDCVLVSVSVSCGSARNLRMNRHIYEMKKIHVSRRICWCCWYRQHRCSFLNSFDWSRHWLE